MEGGWGDYKSADPKESPGILDDEYFRPVVDKVNTPRLFMGIVSMKTEKGGQIHLINESYAGWFYTENDARGRWVSDAMSRHEGWDVSFQAVYDITDVAVNGFKK